MNFIKNLKESFEDTIKEHIISYIMVIIATILCIIDFDYYGDGFVLKCLFPFIISFVYLSVPGVLCCEAIHTYRKDRDSEYSFKDRKNIILYSVITAISVIISTCFSYVLFLSDSFDSGTFFHDYSIKFLAFYIISAVLMVIYFFYKRNGERFEVYSAKVFCGILKAELVYFILSIGFLLIILIFNALIVNTDNISLLPRIETLIAGLVEYPCILVGLSKSRKSLSKFSKVMLSYILTILLAIAFVIIYVYIIKILVTWTFPSNEVFGILTGLFVGGIVIWTMAQGCAEEFMLKPLKIMPFFFMPFIILQIMCISLRIADYGLTINRYYGIALIVFELAYFALYIFGFVKKMELMHNVIYIGIAVSFIIFLMPLLNMESMVLLSQRAKISAYQRAEEDAPEYIVNDAIEAYRTISYECGYTGNRYISKNLTPEEISFFDEHIGEYNSAPSSNFYIPAYNTNTEYNISDFDTMKMVSVDYTRYYDSDILDSDLTALPIMDISGDIIGTVDFSVIVAQFMDIDAEQPSADQDELLTKVIERSIPVSDGGRLIMTYVDITGDRSEAFPMNSITIEGFYLK